MILSLLSLLIFLLFPYENYGSPAKKIIGSESTVCSGERPYQASLWRKKHGILCGGAILDEEHILSAAHCVDNERISELNVGVGCADLVGPKLKLAEVTQIHFYPYFQYVNLSGDILPKNDIAILKIHPSLVLDESITKVRLPKSPVKHGHIGMMGGWGKIEFVDGGTGSRYLMKTPLQILHKDYCPITIPEAQFCAIDPEGRRTVGFGDSGSPLIIAGIAVGILSYSAQSLVLPAYFTDVFFYLSFIENIVSKDVRLLKKSKSCEKLLKRKHRDRK